MFYKHHSSSSCFSYWQGTIQASYAVMRQLLFLFEMITRVRSSVYSFDFVLLKFLGIQD